MMRKLIILSDSDCRRVQLLNQVPFVICRSVFWFDAWCGRIGDVESSLWVAVRLLFPR